jgi:hypothetical protein
LYNYSREWACGIGIDGDVYLARTDALVQSCQDIQFVHQVYFFGEHQQVNVTAKRRVVNARPEQINYRSGIGLADGVADSLLLFVGDAQVCSFFSARLLRPKNDPESRSWRGWERIHLPELQVRGMVVFMLVKSDRILAEWETL